MVRLWLTTGEADTHLPRTRRHGVRRGHQPDGQRLYSCSRDRLVKAWNGEVGQERALGHGNWVHHVSFSHDSRLLASCGRDRAVKLWDVEKGQRTTDYYAHKDEVETVAFSPDARLLASGARDGMVVVGNGRPPGRSTV
jgi:WD40 repeat protein